MGTGTSETYKNVATTTFAIRVTVEKAVFSRCPSSDRRALRRQAAFSSASSAPRRW